MISLNTVSSACQNFKPIISLGFFIAYSLSNPKDLTKNIIL